jgi:Zn-dependent M28 family amino/carboxypeptidase
MRTRQFAKILIGILVAVGALAQQPASVQVVPNAEKLRQHVTYLASDALNGRRTGSTGANDAAHYIAGEFSRLGLRPGAQKAATPRKLSEAMSRYLQTFPYVAGVELGKGDALSITASNGAPVNLRAGDGWMPLGFSSNGHIEKAEYVFVGYGITAVELNYDSYGSGARDKIAIALAGTPDGDNPHGQFARYDDARWKAIAARNAGARALLLIAQEESFKDDRLSQLHYDNGSGDSGLPVAVISRETATRLFASSGDAKQTLSALTEAAKNSKSGVLTSATIVSLPLKGVTLAVSIDVTRQEVPAYNVVGILDGSDPTLKNETVVIGAHYDHLGRGGEGSLAPRSGEIHHGADDNASGVAGVLELARVFSTQRPKPKRTILFVAFSGEEEGLLGSSYYVNHPLVPLANTVAMINMDMIGRMKDRKLIIGGVGTAKEWRDIVDSGNSLQGMTVTATNRTGNDTSNGTTPYGIPVVVSANGRPIVSMDSSKTFDLTLNEDGYGPSDHSSFYSKQIPVLFFWTGTHEDYHKPSDTSDKINYEAEARVLSLVARIVRDIDQGDKRPTYTVAKSESTGRATGFRVYLGTIPNYADTNDGLLLDGVRDDSPASAAGLKAGDRIVKIAGRDVHNVYDYTYALGEMKAGQEYSIEVVRGTERVTLKITPAARKQ